MSWWLETPERWFNGLEAGLWLVIAVGFMLRGRSPQARLLALNFALFGASDLVEAHTGAWWTPWWLLAWKAACIVGFAAAAWRYRATIAGR